MTNLRYKDDKTLMRTHMGRHEGKENICSVIEYQNLCFFRSCGDKATMEVTLKYMHSKETYWTSTTQRFISLLLPAHLFGLHIRTSSYQKISRSIFLW